MEATPSALPATGLVSSAPGFLFGLTNVQLCCVWQPHVWTGLANISNLILEPRSPDLSFSRNGGSVRTTPWCSRDFYCPYVFQVWQDQPELICQDLFQGHHLHDTEVQLPILWPTGKEVWGSRAARGETWRISFARFSHEKADLNFWISHLP